jgi:hypothetical protein
MCDGCHSTLYCGRTCQKNDWKTHRAMHLFAKERMECSVCNKVGLMKMCDGCHSTLYCGRTCQKNDWKTHRAMHLSAKERMECSVCHKVGLMKRCGVCHSTLYCGRTCQKNDWKTHCSTHPSANAIFVKVAMLSGEEVFAEKVPSSMTMEALRCRVEEAIAFLEETKVIELPPPPLPLHLPLHLSLVREICLIHEATPLNEDVALNQIVEGMDAFFTVQIKYDVAMPPLCDSSSSEPEDAT